MTTKLKEAQDKVRALSLQALTAAEDTTKSFAEQKEILDPLEADIKKWTEEVQNQEALEEKRKQFRLGAGGSLDDAPSEVRSAAVAKSLGEQFVESAEYKSMLAEGFSGSWKSAPVELKTTLAEGTSGTPGGSFSLTNQPTVLPGIVDIKLKPLTIASLIPSGTTDSPLIRYLVETSITNAADAVAEGAAKPESALAFSSADETLKKIATFLPITDETLEDWAQAISYINARLTLFVQQKEEAEILNGSGTGAHLTGLLNRAGLATAIVKGTSPSIAGDTSMDAIYRQITAIRVAQFLEPDAIAIDPLGWQNITLSKTSQGVYYAGGPFVDSTNQRLWGKTVVSTPAMASTTALVGAFAAGAQLFRKGGITVEASNSHADFFQKNLTALRAEERAALAVYRPGAFGLVSGL